MSGVSSSEYMEFAKKFIRKYYEITMEKDLEKKKKLYKDSSIELLEYIKLKKFDYLVRSLQCFYYACESQDNELIHKVIDYIEINIIKEYSRSHLEQYFETKRKYSK